MWSTTTLSNQLTFARLAVIPLICLCLAIPGSAVATWVALILFIAAAVTDYFDGYLARARAESTTLGRVLDPIADKLLVASVLLMLVYNGSIDAITIVPALVILLREVAVSGLREFLAEIKVGLPVSRLAKWKTAIQMTAIPFVIARDHPLPGVPAETIGIIMLWTAAALTLITGWDYWHASRNHLDSPL